MFRLDAGIDSGPLVADKSGNVIECAVPIEPDDYYQDVLDKFHHARVSAYDRLFELLQKGDISFIPQDDSKAMYTCNRNADDAELNWDTDTLSIYRAIRAQSHPCPGAFSYFKNHKFHIWKASIPENAKRYIGRIPGKVVERHSKGEVDVLTGDGVLRIEEISVDGEFVKPTEFIKSVRQVLGYNSVKAISELKGKIKKLEERLAQLEKSE